MKKKKNKNKKTKKKSFNYKFLIFFLLFIIGILSAFIAGYILSEKETKKEIKNYKNTLISLQQKISKLSKEIKKEKNRTNLKITNTPKHINSEIVDFEQSNKYAKNSKNQKIVPIKKIRTKKPKLVIIIDDVAFKNEVKLIKTIPYKITPSFFPPTKRHPNTPKYAKLFSNYMIHIPMEALHFAHPEPNTLLAKDDFFTIKSKIDLFKKEFPKAKFINNHTGSKFTSNLQAMNYLFIALKEDNFGFVDSRTINTTKSSEIDKIHKIPLFQRDIFLDNKQNPQYIRNQLRKAVKLAKKRGYAIAIGHPHKITLETIKNSKDILKQVDVVYIDELAKYAKN